MPKIFISYSSKDRARVDELAGAIDAMFDEVSIWYDRELNRAGGHQWWSLICEEIRQCDIFIYALSTHVLASEPCKREYGYAKALGKPILPVMVDEIDIRYLPRELQATQLVNFRQGGFDQQKSLRLSIRNQPPAPPLPPNALELAPDAPLDPVGVLLDRIANLTSDPQGQTLLIIEIDDLQEDAVYGKFIPDVLERLVKRDDVLTVRNLRRAQELLGKVAPPPAVGTAGAPSATPTPTISIPLLEWLDIPAGDFTMGSDKSRDPQAYDDELPQHNETVAAFKIAKYPVTYAQYELFVAGDGYAERAYWTAAGWEWRGDKTEPEAYWNDPDWHKPDHPVVGVTWYESFAFCNWLTAKLYPDAWQEYLRYRASVPMHTIENLIRLPTEPEWEKAARWDAKRKIALIYPYGDTYDPKKANTTDSGIGHTTPVTAYPNGASPYGVFDMSGNVWEWCLTKWRSNYTTAANNDPEGTDNRVARGGSWNDGAQNSRAAFRDYRSPGGRLNNQGFRLCALS